MSGGGGGGIVGRVRVRVHVPVVIIIVNTSGGGGVVVHCVMIWFECSLFSGRVASTHVIHAAAAACGDCLQERDIYLPPPRHLLLQANERRKLLLVGEGRVESIDIQ